MIEFFIHRGQGHLLPARRVVTGLAGLNKAAMVRIAMAIGAFLKPNIGISRSAVGAWRMTFFARHLRMRSGQRIAGFGVIESPGVPLDERKIFSVVLRVTANALLT